MEHTPHPAPLLERLPFWPNLTAHQQALVLDRQCVIHYPAGTSVADARSDCLGMVLLIKGVFRAYLLSPDGREMTLFRIRAGENCVLSADCALSAVSFEVHIQAEEDSEMLLIPADVFASLVQNNLHVECYSYKTSTERFSDVVTAMERLVFLNIEQRISSYLLDEAAATADGQIHKTHEQIAVDIGSAREVVSRSLKRMEQRGLVALHRGGVQLKNKVALYEAIR